MLESGFAKKMLSTVPKRSRKALDNGIITEMVLKRSLVLYNPSFFFFFFLIFHFFFNQYSSSSHSSSSSPAPPIPPLSHPPLSPALPHFNHVFSSSFFSSSSFSFQLPVPFSSFSFFSSLLFLFFFSSLLLLKINLFLISVSLISCYKR